MDDITKQDEPNSDVVIVNKDKVLLDPKNLVFNEATLNKQLQEAGGWYNYYGQRLADAESILQFREMTYDTTYSHAFVAAKAEGGTEKASEAKAKTDDSVENAKLAVIGAKRVVKKLQQYMRALDKTHESVINFGYMLRKEMDKHQLQIRNYEERVDDIIKPVGS